MKPRKTRRFTPSKMLEKFRVATLPRKKTPAEGRGNRPVRVATINLPAPSWYLEVLIMDKRRECAWVCVVCYQPIDTTLEIAGISLSDTDEEHVCHDCWAKISVAGRLEATRRWRLDRQTIRTLKAVEHLCDGARDGFHLPGLGEASAN